MIGLPYGNKRIGHTAVKIYDYKKREHVIFSFGRYGRTYKNKIMQGEGIMLVYRGERQVKRYIYRNRRKRHTVGYVINLEKEEELSVLAHYESLLKQSRWKKVYKYFTQYRLKRDYNGVTVQCTSVALEGLKKILSSKVIHEILAPTFNKGEGFNHEEYKYYFSMQKKLGINETVVPVDVLKSLEYARKEQHPLIEKRIIYRKYKKEKMFQAKN